MKANKPKIKPLTLIERLGFIQLGMGNFNATIRVENKSVVILSVEIPYDIDEAGATNELTAVQTKLPKNIIAPSYVG